MARCPEKRCQREKGHGLRQCNGGTKPHNVLEIADSLAGCPEAGVIIPVLFDGSPIDVMLDTGAQPSVVDKGTIKHMNFPYQSKDGRIYGIGESHIPICGALEVEIDVGNEQKVRHQLEVLDTAVRTAILGRNF